MCLNLGPQVILNRIFAKWSKKSGSLEWAGVQFQLTESPATVMTVNSRRLNFHFQESLTIWHSRIKSADLVEAMRTNEIEAVKRKPQNANIAQHPMSPVPEIQNGNPVAKRGISFCLFWFCSCEFVYFSQLVRSLFFAANCQISNKNPETTLPRYLLCPTLCKSRF